MKKFPLVSLILGIIIVVYSALAYFIDKDFLSLTNTIGNIVIAAGLIAFAVFVVMPDMKGSAKTLKTVEFVIILIAAILGFVFPLLNIGSFNLGTGSLWFGLALVMNGGIDLYLNRRQNGLFYISLFSVMLGTWIYATNFINRNIRLFTFIVLLVLGGYLIIVGLLNNKKLKNKGR